MQFTEYNKMKNSFSKLTVTKEMEKAEWGVFEKIHGANFSFHVDGQNKEEETEKLIVKVARRRAFLEETENFFNHLDAKFMKSYPDRIRQLYKDLVKRKPDKDIHSLRVWGEIFGGEYPNK